MRGKKNKKIQKQEAFPIPIVLPALSKIFFVVLSLGGHFIAEEYSNYLDSFPTGCEIHGDNDIDDIMNAMEYHEQDRIGLAKRLRSLTEAVESLIVAQKKENKRNNIEIIDHDYFERVESSLMAAVSSITSYRKLLSKQKRMIEDIRYNLGKICKDFEIEIIPFLRSILLFQELVHQYNREIDWEMKCLTEMDGILKDGSIYYPFHHEERVRNTGIHIQNNLKIWTSEVELRSELHHPQWVAIKKHMLEELSICRSSAIEDDPEHSVINESQDDTKPEVDVAHRTGLYTFNRMGSKILKQFKSIESVVNSFVSFPLFDDEQPHEHSPFIKHEMHPKYGMNLCEPLWLLLMGPTGTGKTHFCHQVEARLSLCHKKSNGPKNKVMVIRPNFPADFIGSSMGSFEDSLLSLFDYVKSVTQSQKCILLLDDVDEIFVDSVKSTNDPNSTTIVRRSHLAHRIKNLFLDVMDNLRKSNNPHGDNNLNNLLIICTSKMADANLIDRFHVVFRIGDPNGIERRLIIEHSLFKPEGEMTDDIMHKLQELIANTVGKSRGDLAQHCREALEIVHGNSSSLEIFSKRLDIVKQSILTKVPESIRNKPAVDGHVDMTVSSARELRREFLLDENGNNIFPFFGDNAKYCWAQLQNLVVTPLCRKNDLDTLLYGGNSEAGAFSKGHSRNSGVLLAGPPGTGKSSLARYCAAIATGLDPNIRLLEVSCTSLIHKELGGSERSVHKLFEAVRCAAPCILVLDGIENISQVRGHDNTSEGTMDRLLSTLLIEMDGVSTASDHNNKSGIAVIGITHNPIAWIDPALLRPGRLEKCVQMEMPCAKTRKDIFVDAVKDLKIDFTGTGLFDPKDKEQLAETVAMRTHGKSAADIIAVCNNAKIEAIKENLHIITKNGGDFQRMSIPPMSFRHFMKNI